MNADSYVRAHLMAPPAWDLERHSRETVSFPSALLVWLAARVPRR